MRHVTLDCHLIVFTRPRFFFALWQEMVLVVAAPSISGLWLRLRKHCRSPVAEGGENYPMVFAVSFSNTASALPALLESSPHALWLEFSKKPSWAVLSLFTMTATLLPKKHKRNRSYGSQPSSYACVYTRIPGLLSASHTLSYVGDPEASYLALQGCLEKSTQFLLF